MIGQRKSEHGSVNLASVAEHYHAELDTQDHGHASERLLTLAHGRNGKAGVAERHARAWCNRFCRRFALIQTELEDWV